MDKDELLTAFAEISRLAGVLISQHELRIEIMPAPHRRPSSLPRGTQAIYAFLLGSGCLKVGKAGPKTQARFTSQHYGTSAPSTLTKSIIADRSRMKDLLPPEEYAYLSLLEIDAVGHWLERSTTRLHLYLPASAPPCQLSLAESFLQCRLRPIYEGPVRAAG